MKTHAVKLGNWMILLILLSCVSFITGCLGFEGDSEDTSGPLAQVMNLQISGSILDPGDTAEDFLNSAANSAVLRLIAFDASKNYIDVIDCATGNSVGTGTISSNGTFTVQVDIRAHAGKTIMLVIGLKTANGGKGLAIYKCLLGRMPKTTEIPDSTALDSVKITNVDVSFESTAKALFAMEKGLNNNPAEPFFSISTSEVQAGKTVSKSFSTDNALNKKIESESGGAANIAQVASAVRALAVLASSNVSDTLKTDILQGPVQNVSEALDTYSRLIAKSGEQSVSTIIAQNLIPTELKISTAGGTTVVNGSSTASTNKEAVTGIAAAAIVDMPAFNIKDGEYTDTQTVSLSTKTDGAVIYYTLNGLSPTESFGIKYDAPLSISRSVQIKAAAFKTGAVASQTAYLNLSIKLPASSEGDFYYEEEATGIKITGYRENSDHVVIPGTIKGKPVTTIGYNTFYFGLLTSVVVPDSVTSIQMNAFAYSSSLESVTLSKNLSTIQMYTFYNCDSLTDIVLPNSITKIENLAFRGCTGLKSVTFSENLTSIGINAFEKCASLTNLVLPDSITRIDDSAFMDCTGLKSVTLSENLTSIGHNAFENCSELNKINIPDKVNSIGNSVFYNCSSMYDITIPASVSSMGDRLNSFRNVYFEGDIPTFTTSLSGSDPIFGSKVIFYYMANKKGWTTLPNKYPAISYDINSSKIKIPESGSFTDTDFNDKKISGTISWTSIDPADGILGYHIYWGNGMIEADSNKTGNKLSGNAEILYTVAGAASNSQNVPINTSIPEGATCFLIYSFDANGDSAARCAVAIDDVVKVPTVLPTSGAFTDSDIIDSRISGKITWTRVSSPVSISGYKIYWGQDATTKLSGNTSEVYTVDAFSASQSVAANTVLPAGATHFLIYSYNSYGNSAACLAVPILDLTASSPTILPTSGAFTDLDVNGSKISGKITWTPANPATGISGYKIYWGQNATNILSGYASEVYTVSGANTAFQTVDANTALPSRATHFLIYSFNANGNSATALAVAITDIAVPTSLPSLGIFIDNDPDSMEISGNIGWRAPEYWTDRSGYKIYWGQNATTKLSGYTSEVYTVLNRENSPTVAANTVLPAGATHFLVYSFNAYGNSAACMAVAIIDIAVPAAIPTSGTFMDTDTDSAQISGTIAWTPASPATGISGYKIYWGQDATTKLAGNASEVYTVSGAEKASQTVAVDKVLPAGATHFLIYSYNAYGNSAAALAVAITDIAVPAPIPTSGTFTDADMDSAQISGTITWTPANPATGISGYKIYWGQDATNKLSGNTTEVYTVSDANTAYQAVAADTALPVGATHFLIYSFNAYGNSTAALAVAITDRAVPTALPTAGSFTDADMDSAQISGTITWTPASPATGISGYKIYWGQDATTKLSGNTTEVYTVSGAAAASQTVAADTVLPVGATHFLIYSHNANDNSLLCLAVPIVDSKQVAMPVLPIATGMTAYQKTVTITCATPDAVIYYTLDGTEPLATNGKVYATPFTINVTTLVKAIAVKDGMVDSDTASAAYTIYYPVITPPALTNVTSPAFTTATGNSSVTITLTGGTFKSGAISASDFTFAGTDNAVLAAATTFTRTSDTVVTITGIGALAGGADNTVVVKGATQTTQASSVAAAAVISNITTPAFTTATGNSSVTITLTGGTFKSGAISASDFTFAGTDNAVLAAATTFTRTSDTVVTITGIGALAGGADNTVVVKGATQATQASSVAAAAVISDITSPTFTTVTGNSSVTITLTGGTFKSGAIAASDFTFAGTDNAVLAAATTFTRTSDTVVTITGIGALAGGADNTVTVKGATQATQASSVSAAAVISNITSPAFTTATGNSSVTITLTGGTFKAGAISADDFTFAGTDNAVLAAATTFTRTSDTVVTITGIGALAGGADNTVAVKGATQATQASSVAATTITDVTSAAFTMQAANNTLTITLTGGQFKIAPIAASDFTFAGTDSGALAAGQFTRTSDTVVTIKLEAGLTGADNTVLVKAATQAIQATSVAAAASTVAITDVTMLGMLTLQATNNTVTITLTGGKYKVAPITKDDFTFAGDDASLLTDPGATYTRTSDTVVTISSINALSLMVDENITVTVPAATQVIQAESVNAEASN